MEIITNIFSIYFVLYTQMFYFILTKTNYLQYMYKAPKIMENVIETFT